MSRFYVLGILTYGMLLFGVATLDGGMVALALPLLVYLAFGMLFSPRQLDLQVERKFSEERVLPDIPVQVQVTVMNRGEMLEEVLLEDFIPEGLEVVEGSSRLLACLPNGGRVTYGYSVSGKRGMYRFQELRASAFDRLGIFRRQQDFSIPGRILVVPHALRIKHVAIRPRETRVYSGTIPARQGGSGVDFFGVRNYQESDPIRYINWKMSARHDDKLFINEFEQERVADVGIILDARRSSDIRTPQGMLFEHAVTAAATLAQALLSDGNRLSLLVYGSFLDWTYPGYGKIQRERIFKALARAQPGESLVFDRLENLPTRVFPFHSQIILITPVQPDELPTLIRLRALGYQVMVVSPDPVSFEVSSMAQTRISQHSIALARLERRLLFKRLRHAGVHVINWEVSTPFDRAVNHLLARLPPWYDVRGMRL